MSPKTILLSIKQEADGTIKVLDPATEPLVIPVGSDMNKLLTSKLAELDHEEIEGSNLFIFRLKGERFIPTTFPGEFEPDDE